MKKVILTSTIATALSSVSYAMTSKAPAKSGLVFEGQFLIAATPQQTFDQIQDGANGLGASTDERNGGIGGDVFIGYDYAFNPNMTVGAKVGYRYLYEVNYLKIDLANNSGKFKLNMYGFPVLATWKYFFDSGWLVGADAGIDIQKWKVDEDDDYSGGTSQTSSWNVAPMVGISGGYKWQNGLALTGVLTYVFGTSTDNLKLNGDDDNDALAV
ncbi:autotransporter outer membrane beta-barrel domain-containing protein [Thiotrichales bacterium 19X7-9]|nr:autotransporter outer membrane beta-barrel domain-containing protein [Thiotrichales bacterium 19X7-9]